MEIRQLSNADKHKILHISAACAESYNANDCYIEGILTNMPRIVKNNTVIAKLGIIRPKDPSKNLKELVYPRMNIAFSEGILENHLVLNTLDEIIQFVGKKVLTPLQKFL